MGIWVIYWSLSKYDDFNLLFFKCLAPKYKFNENHSNVIELVDSIYECFLDQLVWDFSWASNLTLIVGIIKTSLNAFWSVSTVGKRNAHLRRGYTPMPLATRSSAASTGHGRQESEFG